MDPVSIALLGGSLLGGIFGRKKRKAIDIEELRNRFGSAAISKETAALFNQLINSPQGQALLESAAAQGQNLQTEMASRAAASGLSPDTGGQSGVGDFSTAAAAGATSGLQRQVRSNIYSQAVPAAMQMVQGWQNAYLQDREAMAQQPTTLGMLGQAAAMALPYAGGGRAAPAAGASLPTAALADAANFTPTMPAPRRISPAAASLNLSTRPQMQDALVGRTVRPLSARRRAA